jgi:hypothetical protein
VNSDRRALTGLQKFWASVAAGNREAAALAKACEGRGHHPAHDAAGRA